MVQRPMIFLRACKFQARSTLCARPAVQSANHARVLQIRRLYATAAEKRRDHDFAFAFDIDGVLLRSKEALPKAQQSLQFLHEHHIPFILLTNGGGRKESKRAEVLKGLFQHKVPIDDSMIVQSHTPLKSLADSLADKDVLVVGGEGDECRGVAQSYGFRNVRIPADFLHKYPNLQPFCNPTTYKDCVKPLGRDKLSPRNFEEAIDKDKTIKIDAIMVFNDPRDWALDTQIILDLLMSHRGYLGSLSPKNGDVNLPNNGYQQDGQPPLYFTNPDLFWAAGYHLSRLGQGAFREAFEGVWAAVTGGAKAGVILQKEMLGKPFNKTYDYAEDLLFKHRARLMDGLKLNKKPLRHVYMIGDNPESDILGANQYGVPASHRGVQWHSLLVRSGVYGGGTPAHEPMTIVDDVWQAVQFGKKHADVEREMHGD